MAWSVKVKASLSDPAPERAMMSKASFSNPTCSRVKICSKCLSIRFCGIFLNLKCWVRESMVAGSLRGSVVAKINLTKLGGSSSVLSRALKA